jgi:hypothetical protein
MEYFEAEWTLQAELRGWTIRELERRAGLGVGALRGSPATRQEATIEGVEAAFAGLPHVPDARAQYALLAPRSRSEIGAVRAYVASECARRGWTYTHFERVIGQEIAERFMSTTPTQEDMDALADLLAQWPVRWNRALPREVRIPEFIEVIEEVER